MITAYWRNPKPSAADVSRRSFLRLAGIGVLVAATGCLPQENPDWPLVQQLGQAYLDRAPEEADLEVLEQLLLDVEPDAPLDELMARLASDVIDDFAQWQSRTVLLSGWMLSLTEARLAAYWLLSRDL